jgi:ABC-2 type transport system permease protein
MVESGMFLFSFRYVFGGAISASDAGRTLADFTTNGWSIIFTATLGFAFGFRLPASTADGLAALGLCLLYGLVFTVVFIVIGLFAPNAQAAQGMSMIAFVLAFISSTYVPPSSMPGWLQPFARYQPVTPMVNAVRSALTGGTHDLAAALIWSAALIIAFTPVAVLCYRRA